MGLSEKARSINKIIAGESKMEIGAEIMHPNGYIVKIKSGCFLDPIYGRVSNFWRWNRINEDGSLGKEESGYGW